MVGEKLREGGGRERGSHLLKRDPIALATETNRAAIDMSSNR